MQREAEVSCLGRQWVAGVVWVASAGGGGTDPMLLLWHVVVRQAMARAQPALQQWQLVSIVKERNG